MDNKMDISTLTLADLKTLLDQIPQEIKRREKDEKAKALKELAAFAADRGFTLADLLSTENLNEKKARAAVAIKYRHPTNPELTSTGRGRQAKWIEEWLAAGGTLDQLAV
jgi:DNA-binding protein H-NS